MTLDILHQAAREIAAVSSPDCRCTFQRGALVKLCSLCEAGAERIEAAMRHHCAAALAAHLRRIVAEMRNECPRYKSHDLGFVDSVSASRVDEWADELDALLTVPEEEKS